MDCHHRGREEAGESTWKTEAQRRPEKGLGREGDGSREAQEDLSKETSCQGQRARHCLH